MTYESFFLCFVLQMSEIQMLSSMWSTFYGVRFFPRNGKKKNMHEYDAQAAIRFGVPTLLLLQSQVIAKQTSTGEKNPPGC